MLAFRLLAPAGVTSRVTTSTLASLTTQFSRSFAVDVKAQEKKRKEAEKLKAAMMKEKEKQAAMVLKEKEKLKKQKEAEKVKAQAEKQKEKDRKVKESEKIKREMQLEKEKALKEKEKIKAAKEAEKEKEKALKEKEKSKKPQRDPNMPRRALSAYFLYAQSVRDSVRASSPSLGITDIAREISKRWNTLPTNEKQKFITQGEAHKATYKKLMEEYEKTLPKPIKRSLSPYILFSMEHRPAVVKKNPGFGIGEVAKELGRRWNALTESDKSKYVSAAEKDKQRYTNEKTAAEKKKLQ